MALKTDIRGMVWSRPNSYVVGREKVREFAKALQVNDPVSHDETAAAQLGYRDVVAPLTFTAIYAKLVQDDFFRHVDVGAENLQIVQVAQRFVFYRAVVAGDVLHARLEIFSVDERFGADMVVTKNVCTNDAGEIVLEAYTTLVGQHSDQSIGLKWDKDSGQVIRTT